MLAVLAPHFLSIYGISRRISSSEKSPYKRRCAKERLDVVNNGMVSGFHHLFMLISSTK